MSPVVVSGGAPGCTLLTLRTELLARGLSDLPPARATQFINDAHTEFHDFASWPWLDTEDTGTTPRTITNLGTVEYVTNDTQNRFIPRVDKRAVITGLDAHPTTVGTASVWYRDGTQIKVYPVNTTDTFTVRYWAVPAQLVADGDLTANPARYCSVIVALAQALVLRESKDNPELGDRLYAHTVERIGRIAARVLADSVEPDRIEIFGGYE